MYSKTCLHFFTKDSKESIFWHLLEENLELNVGDTFDYSKYYHLLDIDNKNLFHKIKLPLTYKVEHIGEAYKDETLKIINLKPL